MEQHQHMEHSVSPGQSGHKDMPSHGVHGSHHAMMVADFRRRFWVSLAITIPILVLSPVVQDFFPS